jgi:hypothetical protein
MIRIVRPQNEDLKSQRPKKQKIDEEIEGAILKNIQWNEDLAQGTVILDGYSFEYLLVIPNEKIYKKIELGYKVKVGVRKSDSIRTLVYIEPAQVEN